MSLSYIRPPGYRIRQTGPSEYSVTFQGERIARTVTEAAARVARTRHARRNLPDAYMVRRVTSASHRPSCRVPGTNAVTVVDAIPVNDLIKMVNTLAEWHGHPEAVRPCPVGETGYRWAWEWFAPDGHRVSEMIIATPIR